MDIVVIIALIVLQGVCSALEDDATIFQTLQQLERTVAHHQQIYSEQRRLINQQEKIIEDLTQRVQQLEENSVRKDQLAGLEEAIATQHDNGCLKCKENSSEADNTRNSNLPSIRGKRQSFRRIAFTAYLDHTITHLGIDQAITYNTVLLNEGNAYSPHTGVFTCPMDGLYVFYFSTATWAVSQSVVKLVIEGANVVDAIADTYHGSQEAQGANFAVLSLRAGQQVWVANYRWTDKTVSVKDVNRFATFSGFMLY
ncbi:hypothetical protein ACF0H5_013990 [Mactra antiquata]